MTEIAPCRADLLAPLLDARRRRRRRRGPANGSTRRCGTARCAGRAGRSRPRSACGPRWPARRSRAIRTTGRTSGPARSPIRWSRGRCGSPARCPACPNLAAGAAAGAGAAARAGRPGVVPDAELGRPRRAAPARGCRCSPVWCPARSRPGRRRCCWPRSCTASCSRCAVRRAERRRGPGRRAADPARERLRPARAHRAEVGHLAREPEYVGRPAPSPPARPTALRSWLRHYAAAVSVAADELTAVGRRAAGLDIVDGASVLRRRHHTSIRVTKRAPEKSLSAALGGCRRNAPAAAGRAWVPGGRARSPLGVRPLFLRR